MREPLCDTTLPPTRHRLLSGLPASRPHINPMFSTVQVYYIPIHRTFQGVLTQLRLRPGVEAEGTVGRRNSSLSPRRGDAFEIDWVCKEMTSGLLWHLWLG